MANILYIGFGELIGSVSNKLSATEGVTFREVLQLSSAVHENMLADGDTFLIGPYTLEPLRQVQRAHKQNPLIAIVVLCFEHQCQKIKQAIQFSYNIGKHVTIVSYELGKDISTVIDGALVRTQQRKSYARIISRDIYPRQASVDLTLKNLSAFLENAPIGAIVFDDQKNIVTANFKAKQLFDPILDEPSNVIWTDLFPDKESTMPALQPDVGSESLHKIIKVNNQFLEINISSLAAEDDEPRYLLLLNDITDRIRAENQLKSKIDELEFLNQELDDFVNVISHDFKTPLTAISLLAQLGLRDVTPEKRVDLLQQISISANKLKEMLKGLNILVDISKPRSQKLEYVNFQDRLEIISTEYTATLEELGGSIRADFSQQEGMHYFTAHIDSFFSNLITNAIKYRKPNEAILIDIKSHLIHDYVILSVKDNGIGIDLARNMNMLFQPFKRISDQGTGSGLGLSIVKRLIEKNQGYLEVFSEKGKGTEFKAYLKEQQ